MMKRTRTALTFASVVCAALVSFSARADESTNEPPTTQSMELKRDRYADANSDRVILFSTAQTHPKGTLFFSDYELVVLQVGYAFTDSFQLSFTGVPPLVKEQPYVFDVTGKLNLMRSETFNAALVAGLGTISIPDDDDSFWFARLGGIAQVCIDALCRSSVSFNVGTTFNDETLEEGIFPVTLAGGLIYHVGGAFSLLVEPAYAFAITGDRRNKVEGPDGFLLSYGARLSGESWGVDLAFLRPVGSDEVDTGDFIMGLPFLSFTYRGNVL